MFYFFSSNEDLYLTSRLLMVSYGLSCPALILIFIFIFNIFPKVNGATGSVFFRKFFPYIKNLSGFCWIFLGLVLFFNTVLSIFYLVDILVIGNISKYSVYGESGGSKRPLSVFLFVIAGGSFFYGVLAYVCGRKFGKQAPLFPFFSSSSR